MVLFDHVALIDFVRHVFILPWQSKQVTQSFAHCRNIVAQAQTLISTSI